VGGGGGGKREKAAAYEHGVTEVPAY